ncbi:MAG: Uroporphyrin-III C/tetrapyrrole (Corrin/Porphyrin) methyltransferase [Ilumatobacteraceae bacterium]|jgi:precorrin-4/cobalt-precorrin-4 C11-methyltransferase|nr:Uroporphyrin-III C/tetrapyrrole (Corrin/Porphyrin) methyltransferase [Ilumatobacteraceae bacterium]
MISFIGAGPGAADLITLRGAQRLREADVVVWAASLVPEALLTHCRPDAEIHDSKRMTLEQVCDVYARHPDAAIVRLHSGDPAVYSAIGEQIAWCRANDRPFEIVPGVSSLGAVAAAAGCELTIPAVAQSVVLTRLAAGTRASMPARETIAAYAATGATLALFLSAGLVDHLAGHLLGAGSAYTAATPVLIGQRVSWPDELLIRTTIGEMAADAHRAAIEATALILVGPALAGADDQSAGRSHVYDAAYTTRFRRATGVIDG